MHRCTQLKHPHEWHRLPDLPAPYSALALYAKKPIIYRDHVWLFNNNLRIARFDLIRATWGTVLTKIESNSSWPYQENKTLRHPSVELYKHTLLVFGGDQSSIRTGTDVLLRLDLRTLEWRQMSMSAPEGGSGKNATNWPHPRRAAASWVIPAEERLYIMYGETQYYNPDDEHAERVLVPATGPV